MTDEQKLNKLHDLASIIARGDKDSMFIREFSRGALSVIDECNESWCDSCPIKEQVGQLCSDWLNL